MHTLCARLKQSPEPGAEHAHCTVHVKLNAQDGTNTAQVIVCRQRLYVMRTRRLQACPANQTVGTVMHKRVPPQPTEMFTSTRASHARVVSLAIIIFSLWCSSIWSPDSRPLRPLAAENKRSNKSQIVCRHSPAPNEGSTPSAIGGNQDTPLVRCAMLVSFPFCCTCVTQCHVVCQSGGTDRDANRSRPVAALCPAEN